MNKSLRKAILDLEEKLPDFCEECGETGGFLSKHHRYRRIFYKEHPEFMFDHKHNLRLCHPCHNVRPPMSQASEDSFKRLRSE